MKNESRTDTVRLDDMTIAILATDGFEESELRAPLRALRATGADVHVVAPDRGTIRGWSDGDWSDEVGVDHTLDALDPDAYDALVLPGGVLNPDSLRTDADAVDRVRAFVEADKVVAAICHGPWLLVEAGVVDGREVTSWPSVRTDLENAGARWVDEPVVSDGNVVTSRKPDDLPEFCERIVELLGARSSARVG